MTKNPKPARDELPGWRQYENFENKDLSDLEETALRLVFMQEIIKIVTGILAVLLSLKGLLVFYGGKQSNWLDETVSFLTTPFLAPFTGASNNLQTLEMPVFLSVISILFLGALLYAATGFGFKFALWLKVHNKKALSAKTYSGIAKKKLKTFATDNDSKPANYKLTPKIQG